MSCEICRAIESHRFLDAENLIKEARRVNGVHYYSLNRGPVYYAIEFYQSGILKFLLRKGANIHTKDFAGLTPFAAAVTYENIEALKILLRHGARTDTISKLGETPLELSIRRDSKKVTQWLLKVLAKRRWKLFRVLARLLFLHAKAVVTANHPSRIDFSCDDSQCSSHTTRQRGTPSQ